jgi:hypothetical protein
MVGIWVLRLLLVAKLDAANRVYCLVQVTKDRLKIFGSWVLFDSFWLRCLIHN